MSEAIQQRRAGSAGLSDVARAPSGESPRCLRRAVVMDDALAIAGNTLDETENAPPGAGQ